MENPKNIADVISSYVSLTQSKKKGTYIGVCPFHVEKTPSFTVSSKRGVYHCFGCGVGGDADDFLKRISASK